MATQPSEPLITDRTWEDVLAGNSKGYYNLSDMQRVLEWTKYTVQLYNESYQTLKDYADQMGVALNDDLDFTKKIAYVILNRVITDEDPGHFQGKVSENCTENERANGRDVLSELDAELYLKNIAIIYTSITKLVENELNDDINRSYDILGIPKDLNNFTYQKANAVEQALETLINIYNGFMYTSYDFIQCISANRYYSGDIYAGEI